MYGRRHFTRNVIPEMAKKVRENIVKGIGENKFAITSNGWQKPSKFPALIRLIKICFYFIIL
jgi:hypothetical protein